MFYKSYIDYPCDHIITDILIYTHGNKAIARDRYGRKIVEGVNHRDVVQSVIDKYGEKPVSILLSGTLYFDGPVFLYKNKEIVGFNAKIIMTESERVFAQYSDVEIENVTIANIEIDGVGQETSGSLIIFQNAKRVVIMFNKFRNAYNHGVALQWGYENIIAYNLFENCARNGTGNAIYLTGYISGQPNTEHLRNIVIGNIINTSGNRGIYVEDSPYTICESNVIFNCVEGITVGGYQIPNNEAYYIVKGNNIIKCKTGIISYYAKYSEIIGNVVKETEYNGILVTSEYNLVVSNIIINCGSGYDGIRLKSSYNFVAFNSIIDNRDQQVMAYAIRELDGDNNIIIRNYTNLSNVVSIVGSNTITDALIYTSLPTSPPIRDIPIIYHDTNNDIYYLAVWDGTTWRRVQLT